MLLRDEPGRLADAKLGAFTPGRCVLDTAGDYWARPIATDVVAGRLGSNSLLAYVAAHQLGVKLRAGSHVGWRCFYPGIHWELEFLVEAGLTPLEVVELATGGAARALGVGRDLGTIAPDKLADIVLLDANPLEDIRNTQSIWRTIKGGWVVRSAGVAAARRECSKLMPLSPGTTLGPYQILSPIGAGGLGEVYCGSAGAGAGEAAPWGAGDTCPDQVRPVRVPRGMLGAHLGERLSLGVRVNLLTGGNAQHGPHLQCIHVLGW